VGCWRPKMTSILAAQQAFAGFDFPVVLVDNLTGDG
jgi:hypothetical protein